MRTNISWFFLLDFRKLSARSVGSKKSSICEKINIGEDGLR